MGNIIIILIYLSEDLAATSTEAVTQGRSLSSPCYYTPLLDPSCPTSGECPTSSSPLSFSSFYWIPSRSYGLCNRFRRCCS